VKPSGVAALVSWSGVLAWSPGGEAVAIRQRQQGVSPELHPLKLFRSSPPGAAPRDRHLHAWLEALQRD